MPARASVAHDLAVVEFQHPVGQPCRRTVSSIGDSSDSTRSSRSRVPHRRSRSDSGTPTFSAAVRIGISAKPEGLEDGTRGAGRIGLPSARGHAVGRSDRARAGHAPRRTGGRAARPNPAYDRNREKRAAPEKARPVHTLAGQAER